MQKNVRTQKDGQNPKDSLPVFFAKSVAQFLPTKTSTAFADPQYPSCTVLFSVEGFPLTGW